MDTKALRKACTCARCGVGLEGVPDVLTAHAQCAPIQSNVFDRVLGPRLVSARRPAGSWCDVCRLDTDLGGWVQLMLCQGCITELRDLPKQRTLHCYGCLVRTYRRGGLLFSIHHMPACAPSLVAAPRLDDLFERGGTGEPCCGCGNAGLPKPGLVFLCATCAPTPAAGRELLRARSRRAPARAPRRSRTPAVLRYSDPVVPRHEGEILSEIRTCSACGQPIRAMGQCGCS